MVSIIRHLGSRFAIPQLHADAALRAIFINKKKIYSIECSHVELIPVISVKSTVHRAHIIPLTLKPLADIDYIIPAAQLHHGNAAANVHARKQDIGISIRIPWHKKWKSSLTSMMGIQYVRANVYITAIGCSRTAMFEWHSCMPDLYAENHHCNHHHHGDHLRQYQETQRRAGSRH